MLYFVELEVITFCMFFTLAFFRNMKKSPP